MLSPSLLPIARQTAKATPYSATISSSCVALAARVWVMASSATLVIEVSISGRHLAAQQQQQTGAAG